MQVRTLQMQITLLLTSLLIGMPASAGYWFNSSGEVWRNSAGECLHTGFWTPQMRIVGCDGMVAEAPVTVVVPPEPEPAPVVPAPPVVATLDTTVNFAFDRSDLDAQARSEIDARLADARSRGEIRAVRLSGHTDRIGTEQYNLDLSLRRAESVSEYLTGDAAIEPQLIEIAGKGESQPLVACEGIRGAAAINCLAPNRRVDIVFDLLFR